MPQGGPQSCPNWTHTVLLYRGCQFVLLLNIHVGRPDITSRPCRRVDFKRIGYNIICLTQTDVKKRGA